MKKTFLFLIGMLVFCLASCGDQWSYRGNNSELHSVAVYSVLGVESNFADEITIIEEDGHGRVMFTFVPRYAINNETAYMVLLISQKTEDDFAYFYEDVNFLITTEETFSGGPLVFSEEDIDNLKTINDWGNEFDESKCIKVPVSNKKELGTIENDIIETAFTESISIEENHNIWICFLNQDEYGRQIYYIQLAEQLSNPDGFIYEKGYVIVFYQNGTYDENTYILELADKFNYQIALSEFKALNNWHHPIETE
ncbi:MAG: hypothetical protein PHC32_06720 [Candidatus Izemoplasmatales bacterium]|nr:hypothetical protein [Candidatus Izemoplasmatales bacterium]MDD3865983.1 hypothetical protein [Candidatus Izemoplasmatales bacterium]